MVTGWFKSKALLRSVISNASSDWQMQWESTQAWQSHKRSLNLQSSPWPKGGVLTMEEQVEQSRDCTALSLKITACSWGRQHSQNVETQEQTAWWGRGQQSESERRKWGQGWHKLDVSLAFYSRTLRRKRWDSGYWKRNLRLSKIWRQFAFTQIVFV